MRSCWIRLCARCRTRSSSPWSRRRRRSRSRWTACSQRAATSLFCSVPRSRDERRCTARCSSRRTTSSTRAGGTRSVCPPASFLWDSVRLDSLCMWQRVVHRLLDCRWVCSWWAPRGVTRCWLRWPSPWRSGSVDGGLPDHVLVHLSEPTSSYMRIQENTLLMVIQIC